MRGDTYRAESLINGGNSRRNTEGGGTNRNGGANQGGFSASALGGVSGMYRKKDTEGMELNRIETIQKNNTLSRTLVEDER